MKGLYQFLSNDFQPVALLMLWNSVYFDLNQKAKLPASLFSCDIVVERLCASYSYFDVKILMFQLFYFVSDSINHRSPNVLWQVATSAIARWFAGQIWETTVSGVPTRMNY
jgi:hypothetical protein